MTQKIIATWIINDTKLERSYFPQAGGLKSDHPAVHDLYWRCVVGFYACATRAGNASFCRLLLFTNRPAGEPYLSQLHSLQVEIVLVPLNHLPPVDYYRAWRNQFYILDILKYLAVQPGDFSCAILDSDCLINRPLDEMFSETHKNGALLFTIPYREDAKINGLTRLEMKALFEEIGGERLASSPDYCGGEFFAATHQAIREMVTLAAPVWQQCLSRAANECPRLNEEAHLLSYLYNQLGYTQNTANSFIKRLWTQFSYRNVESTDFDLPIWHVPAEKRYGLRRLYAAVIRRESWFWTEPSDDRWRHRLGLEIGIPDFTWTKKLFDIATRLQGKLF